MIVPVPFAFQFVHCRGLLNKKLNSQDERPVAHKLSSLNRKSFLLAQGEILRFKRLR